MPNVVLQVEELVLDALRLRDGLYASCIIADLSVEGIVFFDDVA